MARPAKLKAASMLLGTVVFTGLLAGCQDSSLAPQANVHDQSARLSAPEATVAHPGEAVFENISNQVPSFAGFFLDGQSLVVYVADSAQARAAESAVRRAVSDGGLRGADPQLAGASLIVRQARHSYRQLRQWRDQVMDVLLDLPDAAWIDLDEAQNQIAIGLADGSGRGELERALAGLGVVGNAVRVEITGRSVPNETLESRIRPVVGGIAQGVTFNGAPQVYPWCTYSFNARYNGVDVILTASHCSQSIYYLDQTPTVFYQNYVATGNRIGGEWLDPPAVGEGCVIYPYGYRQHCHRYSDAVMIAYDPGVASDRGFIARTTSRSLSWGQRGSTTIDPSNPRFGIVSVLAYPVQGQRVDKVGWKSGWTSGTVQHTCVNVVATDGYWRDCTYQADYWSEGGDSGSPVFTWPGTGSGVTLVGIHWGKGEHTDFSPFGGLERDFVGLIIATVPVPPSVIIVNHDTYYYDAVPAGGEPPYVSVYWESCGIDCSGGGGDPEPAPPATNRDGVRPNTIAHVWQLPSTDLRVPWTESEPRVRAGTIASTGRDGVHPNVIAHGWQFLSTDWTVYWTESQRWLRATVTDSKAQEAVATFWVP